MIALAGEREVDPGLSGVIRHRQISVVGQPFEQFLEEGRCDRESGRLAKRIEHGAAAWPAAQQQRRTLRSRAFDIDHCCDVVGPCVLREECFGAEQSCFFTVGEREQDAVAGLRLVVQRARDFEQRRNTGAVVARTGRRSHRIVVGHQQNAGSLLTFDSREYVLHAAANRPLEAAGDGVLHFGRETEFGEPLDETPLDQHVGRAADRMRSLVAEQPRELVVRAHRGEGVVRRVGQEWRRRSEAPHPQNEYYAKQDQACSEAGRGKLRKAARHRYAASPRLLSARPIRSTKLPR